MSRLGLALRSLRFHRRSHVGVMLGTAVAAAVIVGALLVGDSVRATLRTQTLQRIGRSDIALIGGDRFFRAALADAITAAGGPGNLAAPLLQVDGTATTPDRAHRAGGTIVSGVDERFFALSLDGPGTVLPTAGEALVNGRLAEHLAVQPGDQVVIRVAKPSALPRDIALAVNDDLAVGLRVTIKDVLEDDAFGRFGLAAGQVPPFNAFVDLGWLQEQLALPGRANLLLAAGLDVEEGDRLLGAAWSLDDAGIETYPINGTTEVDIVSRRVFLDDAIAASIGAGTGVLTYFVNDLSNAGATRSTPYSMVSAVGMLGDGPRSETARLLPADLADDETVVNRWLADDLGVGPGDTLDLTYFELGPGGRLDEARASFRVRSVVEIEAAAADPSLMPDYPGIAESDHCRDWEPGIPIDLDRIRDEDEAYWDDHRGTPKAFIGLDAGTRLWANRFGGLTAIRVQAADLEAALGRCREGLAPASIGLFFQDVRERALASATTATDFGGLFLGLSFFLVVSAFLLIAMLYAIGIESRSGELGTLLATGFRPRAAAGLFLLEGGLVALTGSIVGAGVGIGYTQAVLVGLTTIWRDAVGPTALELAVTPRSVIIGIGCSLLGALATIVVVLRRRTRQPAVLLLRGTDAAYDGRPRGQRRWIVVAILTSLAALGIVLATGADRGPAAAGAFFGAGALLVIAVIAASALILGRLVRSRRPQRSIIELGVSNGARRPLRSIGVIAMLACGVFLVTAVGANRLDAGADATERSSGTGGFALFATSSIPVPQDIGGEAGSTAFGLDPSLMDGTALVSMRVKPGDEASCLNLAVPQQPRLVGVDQRELESRRAFSFGSTIEPTANPWSLLAGQRTLADGTAVVPAIGDAASLTWVMHKSVGDTLEYRDEQGRPYLVQIVGAVSGSILQGSLLISDGNFQARYPGRTGYGMFLIDTEPGRVDEIAEHMTSRMADVGFEATRATRRLAEFNAVQNTYLAIFQVLGGLGLLLGCAGLGTAVLRNIIERRSELGVLRALGMRETTVHRMILSEHAMLLLLGVAGGVGAAFVAIIPALRSPDAAPPLETTGWLIALVVGSGLMWIWIATAIGLRGGIVAALRAE